MRRNGNDVPTVERVFREGREVSLRYRTGRNTTDSYPEVSRAVRALFADRRQWELLRADPSRR